MTNPLDPIGRQARAAGQILAHASATQKNASLDAIAAALKERSAAILAANEQDSAAAKAKGMAAAQLDRLTLTPQRLQAMIDGVIAIRNLPDPVGRRLDGVTRPNGLKIEKHSVPIGVIGIIFESRPNVTTDAATLCIKSGNACILRGGSDSWQSAQILIAAMQAGLQKAGLPGDAVQSVPSPDRELVGALLTLDTYVDLIIPRGGKSLTERVRKESRVPVLSHLDGICHTYIDTHANAKKAVAITLNAKMRRTSICGATECLLLHKDIAATIGKDVIAALLQAGCEVRVPQELLKLLEKTNGMPAFAGMTKLNESNTSTGTVTPAKAGVPFGLLKLAAHADYGFEFLAPVIAVAVVDDVKAAVDFINHYGSQHTDAIVTEDAAAADYFLHNLNSAIAIHNASTQFADGGEFGKGAEIGIATGKLHARGPVGLEELTTYQYRVLGDGQIRPL